MNVGKEEPLKVWPVLVCAEGDLPFKTKLTGSVAHTCGTACFDCVLEGQRVEIANTTRSCSIPFVTRFCPSTCMLAELEVLVHHGHSDPLILTDICRWLGFADDMNQKVPCYPKGHPTAAGQTLHPTEQAAIDSSGDNPRLPLGYIAADRGELGIRSSHTAPQPIPASTWTTDNVLKLSATERLVRGRKAALLNDQVLCT